MRIYPLVDDLRATGSKSTRLPPGNRFIENPGTGRSDCAKPAQDRAKSQPDSSWCQPDAGLCQLAACNLNSGGVSSLLEKSVYVRTAAFSGLVQARSSGGRGALARRVDCIRTVRQSPNRRTPTPGATAETPPDTVGQWERPRCHPATADRNGGRLGPSMPDLRERLAPFPNASRVRCMPRFRDGCAQCVCSVVGELTRLTSSAAQ